MKDGNLIRPAGRISTIAEINETRANAFPIDYGYRGDEPKRTWDGADFVPEEPDNLAPTAAFAITGTGLVRTFDATNSFDNAVATPLVYEWVFGDGTVDVSDSKVVTHTYVAGTYRVTLLVTDLDGNTGEVDQTVTPA